MHATTIPTSLRYVAGRSADDVAREHGLTRVVKLASNESALGPSPLARRAMERALRAAHVYPGEGSGQLRGRLASALGARADEVLVTNGSTEAIRLAVEAFAPPGSEVVLPAHTFIAYERACRLSGVDVKHAPMRGYGVDLAALSAAVGPRTRLIFLANPNNPTGTIVERAALRAFLVELPAHIVVVLDEAYREFAADDVEDGLLLRPIRERLVLLRTFSKAHGLAALRVGYAVGPAQLLAAMDCRRDPFNVNAVGQTAAEAALDDRAHLLQVVEHNAAARVRLFEALRRIGLAPVPSHANFLLVPLDRPAAPVASALERAGLIVRAMDASGLPCALRITVGSDEDNAFAVRVLAGVLAGS